MKESAISKLSLSPNPEFDELLIVVRKLPVTADGEIVVPNVDPIWIDPHEPGGWAHDEWNWGSWDADDNEIFHPPLKISTWSHYGDHIYCEWTRDHCQRFRNREVLQDHWFGSFYSCRNAAVVARQNWDEKSGTKAIRVKND